MLGYDTSSHPFREDLIGGAISTVNGKVPQGPRIGVEVDRGLLERHGKPFR
jgi:D-galactarolactone cycloisomerase